MNTIHRAASSARFDGAARRFPVHRALGLWAALLLLAPTGCGATVHVPLNGPGLHRAIAQGGQSALHFWWLPPIPQHSAARLLLWDGASVGVSNPAATDQSFTPLKNATNCDQVAVAPDGHAFACGSLGNHGSGVLVQSLSDLDAQSQSLLDESAPLAWAPDSRWLAGLRLGFVNATAVCSVVAVDTSLPDLGENTEQVLLDNIPYLVAGGKGAGSCPVMALAWSPDGTRLALSLATRDGVVLEVLAMGAPGQPSTIESRYVLPGKPLQVVDTPAVPSLFWSSDGQMLAALTGYGIVSEDGLFLLAPGQQTVLTGPNLVDSGAGAALAFAPDSRWLAVGTVGPHEGDDNAQLRVFDTGRRRWNAVAPMYVNGPTLAWSADSALLAAASVSQQGEVIWNWSSGSLNSVIPNQDSASIEQLAWAQDGSALFFALGSPTGGASPYDEVYAQSFPIPPGATSFAFPAWFLEALENLPQTLFWFGVVLLVLIAFAVVLVLIERGGSRRRRAFILWSLGVGAALFALLLLEYEQLPGWTAALYQPYSTHLCQGAPNPCNPGAALALGTLGAPLALGLLVILLGAQFGSRQRSLAPGEGFPKPASRGAGGHEPEPEEELPLLLPPPIDEQDTLELETPPVSALQGSFEENDESDWQSWSK